MNNSVAGCLLRDLWCNFFADWLFFILLIIISFIAYGWWLLWGLKKFREFFGFQSENLLTLYVSNMVLYGTRIPEDPIHDRGISREEFYATLALQRLFVEFPSRVPPIIRILLDKLNAPSFDIDVQISPQEIPKDSYPTSKIILGSARHNTWRKFYLQKSACTLLPKESDSGADGSSRILIRKGKDKTEIDGKHSGEHSLAILEKIYDDKAVILMCVGEHSYSSWGAAEYLVRNWRSLYKKFKTGPFALCLGFPPMGAQDSLIKGYKEPKILYSLSCSDLMKMNSTT